MTAIPMQSRWKEVWIALNPRPMLFRLLAQTKYEETRGFEDDIKRVYLVIVVNHIIRRY